MGLNLVTSMDYGYDVRGRAASLADRGPGGAALWQVQYGTDASGRVGRPLEPREFGPAERGRTAGVGRHRSGDQAAFLARRAFLSAAASRRR